LLSFKHVICDLRNNFGTDTAIKGEIMVASGVTDKNEDLNP